MFLFDSDNEQTVQSVIFYSKTLIYNDHAIRKAKDVYSKWILYTRRN